MAVAGREPPNLLVEFPQHQLTCRRVKDCCAQLHNSMQTWSALNSRSFDILNKLINNLTEQKYVRESSCGIVQNTTSVRERLEGKLIDSSEKFHLELKNVMSEMVIKK